MNSLSLPIDGPIANAIMKTINNSLKRFLHNNVKTRVIYTSQKLGTKFQVKNKTKDQPSTILFIIVNVQNQLVINII